LLSQADKFDGTLFEFCYVDGTDRVQGRSGSFHLVTASPHSPPLALDVPTAVRCSFLFYCSIATEEHGGTCPPPNPSGRVIGIAEIREEKNGGEVGVPGHLGQTDYSELCILVTNAKYISKLNKIQITCHEFNYVFEIFVFPLLENSANKHAEQPRFFSCFTSGSCTLAKYTKLCMVWQPNIRSML